MTIDCAASSPTGRLTMCRIDLACPAKICPLMIGDEPYYWTANT